MEQVAILFTRNIAKRIEFAKTSALRECAIAVVPLLFGKSGRSDVGFEDLLRLHRQANGDIGGTVEFFENLIAEQTAIFAFDAWS